ncbi:MAG: Ig-like domain-containing protein [Methylococcales bacterium]
MKLNRFMEYFNAQQKVFTVFRPTFPIKPGCALMGKTKMGRWGNTFKYQDKTFIVFILAFCFPTLLYASPKLTFVGSDSKSIQFADRNGDFWGTDNGYLNGQPVGDVARKVVKFSGVAGGNPLVYDSTYTELLKPKGSDVTIGPDSYSVIRDVWALPDGNVIFSTVNGFNNKGYLFKLRVAQNKVGNNAPGFDNRQAVMNIGERNGVHPEGFRPLHDASLSIATIKGATVLFFAEYNVGSARQPGGANDWVGLWKSTNLGDSWTKVIEWNTNGHQTSHLHGVRYNPYNKWVYLFFGDSDSESGIVAWDGISAAPPNNTPISQMGNYPGWKSIAGIPAVRTGDMVFTPTKCVWIPDTDAAPQGGLFGQRANHDLSGLEATGSVPYIDKIPPILGYRDNATGNIFWSSFRTEGASEQNLHLWTSNDSGSTWDLAAKIKNYPSYTAMPHSLFKTPWGQLALSGVLGVDFIEPPAGQLPPTKGSVAFFQIGDLPVNTAPVAYDDAATTKQGQPITGNLLANDTDAEANILVSSIIIGTQPANGGVIVNGDGSVTYTPNAGFAGTDTFTYAVKDALGLVSNIATVTVTVIAEVVVEALDDSYVATANSSSVQTVSVTAAKGVGANDLPEGDADRTFAVVSGIKRQGEDLYDGSIALSFNKANGSFNYTLIAPFWAFTSSLRKAAKRGIYQFSYSMTLNGKTTQPAIVTITVK